MIWRIKMYNEKDIKLTINKLWREMKEIKLEQNNALYSVNIRVAQIFVLMKIINKEEMFTKAEINNTNIIIQDEQFVSAYNKFPLGIKPNIQHDEKQLKLEDLPIEELKKYIKNYKKQTVKRKPINPNTQVLEPKERV